MDAEIARLRGRLDELAIRQAEEIGKLRKSLRKLEMRGMEPVAPPPLPDVVMPEAVLQEPVEETAGGIQQFTPEPEIEQVEPVAPEPRGSFELNFGRVWLVRLGIALLVTGLVLLGNYAYRNWIHDLPAVVRLVCLYIGSLGLIGTGWRFTSKDGMKAFGEVVLAGGLAFFYWCTFAAHHIDRLKVVDSPVAAGLMLLVAAGLIVGVSLKRDAKATAVMGLLLASYSTVLQPLGWLSAASNVVLAVAGMMLMRRRDWSGPGIASMVGTYGAFLWWQIAGASGGGPDRMGLFFLPASWAVFSLPGVAGLAGSFSRSLSERGRAWFAGANNGVFFGLFSLLWLMLDYDAYWRVPAVFGLVILVMGAMGRSRESSGSTHIGQGLGMLTLALVLKLDGYQLALGLAVEALMLAVAFLRFRQRLELAFSLLAQLGSMSIALYVWESSGWATGAAALLVGAAAVVVRLGCDRVDEALALRSESRLVTRVGLGAATVMSVTWCMNLGLPWTSLVSMGAALGFAVLALKWDRSDWLPELRWMSFVLGVFGGAVLVVEGHGVNSWVWLSSLLIAGALAVLWERESESSKRSVIRSLMASLLAWFFSLIVSWSLARGVMVLMMSTEMDLLAISIFVPGFAFIAMRVLYCPRLRTSISLLLGLALIYGVQMGERYVPIHFAITISALVTLFGASQGFVRNRAADVLFMIITRAVALLGWVLAWVNTAPDAWIEILALTGGVLVLWKNRFAGPKLQEAWVLLFGTAICLMKIFAESRWSEQVSADLPTGWGVVIGFLVASLSRPKEVKGGAPVGVAIEWLSAIILTLWSTLALVQSMDWSAVAILWTMMGFGFVCGGLWMRLTVWRHAGFALLGIALIKLFAIDVWDFAAFTRVVAFIALGVALVVLGFFYNRFAEILKRLLEPDSDPNSAVSEMPNQRGKEKGG